jgi:DNA modification methylase
MKGNMQLGQSEKRGIVSFRDATLSETMSRAGAVAQRRAVSTDVSHWLSLYDDAGPTSSNQGAAQLPFQRWFRFKEAFSPKFVADIVASLPHRVHRVVDPFAGSGTTGVTCGFLGIDSLSLEVNPFLADIVAAKLTPVSPSSLHYERLRRQLNVTVADREQPDGMPATFRQPGIRNRWVFAAEIYDTVRALIRGLSQLPAAESRLIRVLIGSVLVESSNVVINGKGRRYRSGWQSRERCAHDLLNDLDGAVDAAVADISRFSVQVGATHEVRCGDARILLREVETADLAIFSPPYPNSFDYTDVYNLELWMLDYLRSGRDNRHLRLSTLRSHVQVAWEGTPRRIESDTLAATIADLEHRRADLWDARLPEMVAWYFEDLHTILTQLRRILPAGRHAVIAIGDSQYAGVLIDVAQILREMLGQIGFSLAKSEVIRSMRSGSQHGGGFDLREHCLVLERI